MSPVLLACVAALCWGSAGFAAGQVARRLGPLRTAAAAQSAGVAVLLLIALADRPGFDLGEAAVAAGGGVAGGLGLIALYRGLADGATSVVVPLASTGLLFPAVVGLAGGESLSATQAAGALLLVAGCGLVLLPDARATRRGVRLGLLAAAGFGLFYLGLQADTGGAWSATAGARVGASAVLVALVFARRRPPGARRVRGPALAAAAVAGAVDVTGNLSYASAVAKSSSLQVSLVGATYVAVTVGLAAILLREPVGRRRGAGIVLAVLGAGLLAGG